MYGTRFPADVASSIGGRIEDWLTGCYVRGGGVSGVVSLQLMDDVIGCTQHDYIREVVAESQDPECHHVTVASPFLSLATANVLNCQENDGMYMLRVVQLAVPIPELTGFGNRTFLSG